MKVSTHYLFDGSVQFQALSGLDMIWKEVRENKKQEDFANGKKTVGLKKRISSKRLVKGSENRKVLRK